MNQFWPNVSRKYLRYLILYESVREKIIKSFPIINHLEIFLARTAPFAIQCDYPLDRTIKTKFDTHVTKLGKTATPTGNATMIGNFELKAYSDDSNTKLISTKNPITIGESIYAKITATGLPASLEYQVVSCVVQNTGKKDWEKNSEFITLWKKQTCLNNDLKNIAIDNFGFFINEKSNDYTFNFKAFSFGTNADNQNTMTMVSFPGKLFPL